MDAAGALQREVARACHEQPRLGEVDQVGRWFARAGVDDDPLAGATPEPRDEPCPTIGIGGNEPRDRCSERIERRRSPGCAPRKEAQVVVDVDQQIGEVRLGSIATEPFGQTGPIGLGNAKNYRDLSVEIDQQS